MTLTRKNIKDGDKGGPKWVEEVQTSVFENSNDIRKRKTVYS